MLEQNFMESDSSPKAKAARLTFLREMAGLSFTEFSNKYHIGYSTLRQWEDGSLRQLTTKGAKLIIEAMKKEGIDCELSWLLHGIGPLPFYKKAEEIKPILLPAEINEEIELFKKKNLNSVIFKIEDDVMAPMLMLGDTLGGVVVEKSHFDLIDGKLCIIESETHGIFCRLAQKFRGTDLYNFLNLNLSAQIKKPITIDKNQLIKVAPVIRIWR